MGSQPIGPAQELGENLMKRATVLASLFCASVSVTAFAQTDADLKNAANTPEKILTYGMSYSQQRFSTLKQIDKATVKRRVPAWTYSFENITGEESQPMTRDGIM